MKKFFLFLLSASLCFNVFAQQITYSEPESQDSRALNFEIIGKIQNNYLIYKNIRNNYAICSYDNSMKLLNRVDLSFMNDRILNTDFIAYPNFAWLIYQYQKKNIVHCMAVKINGEGKLLTDPIELDTTYINFLLIIKFTARLTARINQKL